MPWLRGQIIALWKMSCRIIPAGLVVFRMCIQQFVWWKIPMGETSRQLLRNLVHLVVLFWLCVFDHMWDAFSSVFNNTFPAIIPPVVDINRALNQSTWQSGGTTAGKTSALAADGNYDPAASLCIDTGEMEYPWWAVEMARELEVDRIRVIASSEC